MSTLDNRPLNSKFCASICVFVLAVDCYKLKFVGRGVKKYVEDLTFL